MNEQDLKRAFQDVMVASSPPPSMDPSRALGTARRARSRRRAVWAGAAVMVLVVGVGIGASFLAPRGAVEPTLQAGNQPPATTLPPTTRQSGDPWPGGQNDRTQTNGPRADKAVAVMNELTSSLPLGMTSPDLKHPDGRPMRWPQAQYGSSVGEPDYWEYMAMIPVQDDTGAVGQLLVQTRTPDGKPAGDACVLAQTFWGMPGQCSVVEVNGLKVGLVTKNTSGRDDFDQWAAVRHTDGTVVFLAQSLKTRDGQHRPLTHQVFTTQRLTELVTDPKFHLK